MKLKFDPSLDYQQDAINSVVDVFDGQPVAQSNFALSHTAGDLGLAQNELGIGNNLLLDDEHMLKNVQAIQERNDIAKVTTLQGGRNFSIEMETGTGKTYVYLRTIFELSKNYGFKKFIIVVPSVAVREGVLKSIEMTRHHFNALYNNTPFDAFVYDSSRLNNVRQFATSNHIQIMIINIQAFQRDVETQTRANVINRENDKMSGYKPIEFIKATRPMVIIDEPQSVDNTDKAKHAIANLNATTILRYSATHRNPYNLLYKLDPIKAYDLRLVKRIEVASIRSDDNFNNAYVKLLKTDNKKGIRAQVEIHKKSKSGLIKPTKLWLKNTDDDLYIKSAKHEIYREGYVVSEINCKPNEEYIEFNSGRTVKLGQEIGGLGDEIMKKQVYETVKEHLEKERGAQDKGIKVLSLFFIDRVANYRIHNDDGSTSLGKIGIWFEEAFSDLRQKASFKDLEICQWTTTQLHDGYFSKDNKGRAKDTTGKSKDDGDTYSLIMKDKERLLNPNEPLRFIFSHSALREGWDNPNVFQICTLNETQSIEKKRQEIGRGLRLPVNDKGERVHDDNINRLTVIANEFYEDFAAKLQNEFEEDCGIQFGENRVENARERQKILLNKQVQLSDDFKQLWNQIKHRTRYRVEFATGRLIQEAAKGIKGILVSTPSLVHQEGSIDITKSGVEFEWIRETRQRISPPDIFPDILAHLQNETELTRDTLVRILKKANCLDKFLRNPHVFMIAASKEIKRVMSKLMIEGIQYEKIAHRYWDMKLFETNGKNELMRYLKNLYRVRNVQKSIYDWVEFNSDIEKRFAQALDNDQDVKLFIKLPSWFRIDTPIGSYNPDWAFIRKDNDEKLYFVCETKGGLDSDERSEKENQKIECGKSHCDTIGVKYEVAKSLRDIVTRI